MAMSLLRAGIESSFVKGFSHTKFSHYVRRVYPISSQGLAPLSTVSKVHFQRFCLSEVRKHYPACWNVFLLNRTQRRNFSTQIMAPLLGEDFFNRTREIQALTRILRSEPQFSVVTGPVDSGKTSLLLHILQKESEENNRPVLHLNLRERSFNTVNEFVLSIEEEMGSWLKRFSEVAKHLKLNVELYGFKLKASIADRTVNTSPIERLNGLFKEMSDQLPPFSWWSGAQSPILFIDEANKMRTLLKDEQGHATLTNMFEWLVMNTKETHRFHVVMGSSDSFFHLWVEKYIGSSRFKSYIIGDLSQEEAERFWNERFVTQSVMYDRSDELSLPSFEDAYGVCGGNMFFLKDYFSQYMINNGKMQPEHFYLVIKEHSRLISALFRSGRTDPSFYTENGKAIWSREQFIEMMRKLVNSESGFLVYKDLCAEMGDEVVDAFIYHNLLHLRPSKNFAYDLPKAPEDVSILTAETPSSLVAMRKILADIDKGKP